MNNPSAMTNGPEVPGQVPQEAVVPSPLSPSLKSLEGKSEVRMLTEQEVQDAYANAWDGEGDPPYWIERMNAVQRKLLEVNGLCVSSGVQTPGNSNRGKGGGLGDFDDNPCEVCGRPCRYGSRHVGCAPAKPGACGTECDRICQQPDGWGGCGKPRTRSALSAVTSATQSSSQVNKEGISSGVHTPGNSNRGKGDGNA